MYRRMSWLALALTAFACSSVAAQGKEVVAASWHAPQLASIDHPFQSQTPGEVLGNWGSDLDFDPTFGAGGTTMYFLNYPNENIGLGLRLYTIPGGVGWYLLAKHKIEQSGRWDAVVIKVRPNGVEDKVYRVQTPLQEITDAVIDASTGKFYFSGFAHNPDLPGTDYDFGVTCMDIQSAPQAEHCTGFGSGGNGTAFVEFNLGNGNNDFATRVVVRPNIGLVLSGIADAGADKRVIAIASLYRASGALYAGFGTGGRFTKAINTSTPHAYVNVSDAALSADPDAQTRLYVAGNYSYDDLLHDYDGYVLALNAMTGVLDTSFGDSGPGLTTAYLDLGDCSVNCSDAVTAVSVLANGKLALAGWSTDNDLNNQIMLGRLGIDGRYDGAFSGGGVFSPPEPPLSASWGYTFPNAIAERPDTRDLVVAMNYREDGDSLTPTRQVMAQWSATGGTFHAAQTIDFDADSGEVPYSSTAGLLVDADSAMLVGSRRWNATDYDVTLVRTLTNDTLFADSFGGAASD